MRVKVVSGSFSVQAIAGTHCVLLGMNLPQAKCKGLLGFAVRRADLTENETYWMSGFKTFASVEPQPAKGVLFSTRKHPVQSFLWSDYSAKPGHQYTYEVFALRGKPADPQEAETVKVRVTTENEQTDDSPHTVHFNRGSAASQAYTSKFGDKRPDEVGQQAYDWLSRGAAEAIRDFIARAKDSSWGLRVGAYEFAEDHVLQALKDAWKKAKADVQILYHGKPDTTSAASKKKIAKFEIGGICQPRKATGLSLSHNKIIVLTKNGKAKAVLTGSTNFSTGGIYGHSNVVHICEDAVIAAKYLALWEELADNKAKKKVGPILEALSPLPAGTAKGTTPVFSPRPDLAALDWYAQTAKQAEDAIFMTFAFGMNDVFLDAYKKTPAGLRYALMEKMSGPTKTPEEKKAKEAKVIALRKLEEVKVAVGGTLKLGAFDRWASESLTGLNRNVKYLHTKYMLVDPLGANPLVVTGSANFSGASTTNNDENMLLIRGDRRVADIYLGEFMRLYTHYAFRDWLNKAWVQKKIAAGELADVPHLDEKDQWWKRYYDTSFSARQRVYFAG